MQAARDAEHEATEERETVGRHSRLEIRVRLNRYLRSAGEAIEHAADEWDVPSHPVFRMKKSALSVEEPAHHGGERVAGQRFLNEVHAGVEPSLMNYGVS
jgi:hypothetical protein